MLTAVISFVLGTAFLWNLGQTFDNDDTDSSPTNDPSDQDLEEADHAPGANILMDDTSDYSGGAYYDVPQMDNPDGLESSSEEQPPADLDGTTDTIIGSLYADNLVGDVGNDVLLGDAGNDVLSGGPGLDIIYGGEGKDVLYGGPEADLLNGNVLEEEALETDADAPYLSFDDIELDSIFGGDGDDLIHLGSGDYASGGEGQDTFVIDLRDDLPEPVLITDFVVGADSLNVAYCAEDDAPEISLESMRYSDDVMVFANGNPIVMVAKAEGIRLSDIALVPT